MKRVFLLGAAMAVTMVLAALAGAAIAGTRADIVTHLVVVRHGPGARDAARRIEYWIDAPRGLARSTEKAADGTTVHATGPDWVLDLPPAGPGTLYRTAAAGEPPTREVTGGLYELRDALRSGAARLAAEDGASEIVVMRDGRVGAIERSSGLPLWVEVSGRKTTYEYPVREDLAAGAFPETFFADRGGRAVDETIETSLAAVGGLAHMRLYALPADAGSPLEKVLYTRFADDRTLEQVHELYGSGIQVTASLLSAPVTLDRPGGVDVATFAGSGKLYRETWGAQVLVSIGDVVYSVNAPSDGSARSIAARLVALSSH